MRILLGIQISRSIITACIYKLREGNLSSYVCLPVHGGRGIPSEQVWTGLFGGGEEGSLCGAKDLSSYVCLPVHGGRGILSEQVWTGLFGGGEGSLCGAKDTSIGKRIVGLQLKGFLVTTCIDFYMYLVQTIKRENIVSQNSFLSIHRNNT